MSSNKDEALSDTVSANDNLDKVLSVLMRHFGTSFDKDTISNVAASNKGNLTRSIECLMKLKNSNSIKNIPSLQNNNELNGQNMPRKSSPYKTKPKTSNTDKSPKDAELNRIINEINMGHRVLIFMRGLPGSGKSTLARFIIQETVNKENPSKHIFSSDDFFMENGKYRYNVNRLSDAHAWNQREVCKWIKLNFSPIIVDNTNLELWEMHIYAISGVANGYRVEVLEPRTPWALKPAELARRNSHGVSLEVLKRKVDKYQGNVNGKALLSYLNLQYPLGKLPPMMRALPQINVNSKKDTVNHTLSEFFPVVTEKSPQASTSKTSSSYDADFISWDSNLVNETVPVVTQEVLELPKDDFRALNKADTSFSINTIGEKNDTDFDSYEALCQVFANHDSDKIIAPIELITSETAKADSPPKIVTLQNDINNECPKPQRIPSSSKPSRVLERNVLYENVDWEPIDISLSNWESDKLTLEPITAKSIDKVLLTNQTCFVDSSSNTQSFDLNPANWDNFNILTAKSRDINFNYIPISQCLPAKFGLDRGTMTHSDEELISLEGSSVDKLDQIKQLRKLFPDIPMDDIRHIFGKCKGDINWAVDLLLDDKTERGAMNIMDVDAVIADDVDVTSLDLIDTISDEPVEKDSAELLQPDNASKSNYGCIQNDMKNVRIPKKDKVVSESSVLLKKQLEGNFDFCNDLYSDHVFKLKNKIHKGKYTPHTDEISDNTEETIECLNDSNERTQSECSDDIEMVEDVVSIDMGENFINQMDDIFSINIKQYKSLKPIVHMPVSLLNQIHALWIESVINQLEVQREDSKTMMKEDEEFASLTMKLATKVEEKEERVKME